MAGLKVERSTLAPLVTALNKKWGEASPFAHRGLEQAHAIEKGSGRAGDSTH